MTKKTGLGRGLDALIPTGEFTPESETFPASSGFETLPIKSISRNPRQPRSQMDQEELTELSASIKENGILQPLIVSPSGEPGRYILIAGERRLIAAGMAGLDSVPAVVREASEQERLELALIENVQRADLTPLEAAEAYRQLADDFNLSHEQIAQKLGKNRVTITNTMRLLKLPEDVQLALAAGKISEGHARVLLSLPTEAAQSAVLQAIIKHELNVRKTEDLVRKFLGQRPPTTAKPTPKPDVTFLEERLRERLGTRVNLHPRKKGGTMVIHYYSEEELDAIVIRILGQGG
jgi:ParB family chromosome partitioning protein